MVRNELKIVLIGIFLSLVNLFPFHFFFLEGKMSHMALHTDLIFVIFMRSISTLHMRTLELKK